MLSNDQASKLIDQKLQLFDTIVTYYVGKQVFPEESVQEPMQSK